MEILKDYSIEDDIIVIKKKKKKGMKSMLQQ